MSHKHANVLTTGHAQAIALSTAPWTLGPNGEIHGAPLDCWNAQHTHAGIPRVDAHIVTTLRDGEHGGYRHYPAPIVQVHARVIEAAPRMLAFVRRFVESKSPHDLHPMTQDARAILSHIDGAQ